MVAYGWAWKWGRTANGHKVSLDMKVVYENWIMVIVTQLCKYAKNHRMGHFKWVNCTVCKLDLNKAIFKISCMGADTHSGEIALLKKLPPSTSDSNMPLLKSVPLMLPDHL